MGLVIARHPHVCQRTAAPVLYIYGMFRFILALLVAAGVVSAGSLSWYKFTKSPRPQPLTLVHDMLLTTWAGRQAAEALGVENESSIEQLNIPQVAGAMVASVAATVEQRVQEAVVSSVVTHIARQYDGLVPEQKKQLESIICKSAPTP